MGLEFINRENHQTIRRLNKNLKHAFIDRGMSQREVCKAAGMAEATLSLIVNGIYVPSAAQKDSIARTLDYTVEELFT